MNKSGERVTKKTEAKPVTVNMLVPEIVTPSSQHSDLTKPFVPSFQAFAGEMHLIELDTTGSEIPGSDFSIAENTYLRVFQNLTSEPPHKILVGAKFLLKKNNQK